MTRRRRAPAVIAAIAALLVSWTAGPGAAFCMPRMSMPSGDDTRAASAAHAHAGHHGMHGGPRAPEPAPPQDAPSPPAPPECPLMVTSGGSCLVATAPGAAASASFGLPLGDYPPAAGVRDRLLAVSLFRPPKA